MIYQFIRAILFRLDPERVHAFVIGLLALPIVHRILSFICHHQDQRLQKTCFGLTFKNPVGIAAGFDKDGKAILGLQALGVGFIEVGTVTPKHQAGNKKPRIFRFGREKALVNWLGFNNDGVEVVVSRLQKQKRNIHIPIGLNIGKQKETPIENAVEDYLFCLEKGYEVADFFVVNISSPNTPQLRDLQGEEYFSHFLSRLQTRAAELSKKKGISKKPLLVKLSPDLTDEELTSIIHSSKRQRVDGIVATNTTTDYSLLPAHGVAMGGISGKPLQQKSTDFLKRLKRLGAMNIPVIGVGGIFSSEDARGKIENGASLIEVYTGLIYEGPLLIKRIKKSLLSG